MGQGEFDIIALQEPYIQQTGTPACPGVAKYSLVYRSEKAALYIHKKHSPGTWSSKAGENWCSVTFPRSKITVYSIYNRNSATPTSTPLRFISDPAPNEKLFLVGDFNLHHPLWDQYDRESSYSNTLLQLAQRHQLGLAHQKANAQDSPKASGTVPSTSHGSHRTSRHST